MGEPSYCPRPNVREILFAGLPPGVFGFFLGCKGALKPIVCTRADLCMEGCPIDEAFVPIQIKWTDVVSQGWVAPGGNRYWKTSLTATASDPRVAAVLRMLAGRSASKFVELFAKDTGRTMAKVMESGAWVAKYGIMSVPVTPKPQESVAAFIARGGYLLDLRPGFSAILGPPGGRVSDAGSGVKWQGQGSTVYSWLADSDIEVIELWGNYDAAAGKVNYTLRIDYRGDWDKAVNAVAGGISRAMGSFCNKLATNVGTAMTISTAFPAAKPYMGAYTAALAICNLSMAQIPRVPCIPREPRPDDMMAMVTSAKINFTGGGKSSFAAQIPGITAAVVAAVGATPTAPAGPLPPTPPAAFPAGTIAWRDPATPGYDIAVPMPTNGVTHQVVLMGVPTLPAGLHVVDRAEWERATLPWFRRRVSKIGLAVGGVIAAAAATAVAARAVS